MESFTGAVFCACLSIISADADVTIGGRQHMTFKAAEVLWLEAASGTTRVGVALLALMSCASAQQLPDAAKLAPIYQQQRNQEADGRAQCYAIASDLQARIVDLEKQIAAAAGSKEPR